MLLWELLSMMKLLNVDSERKFYLGFLMSC